MMVIVGAIGKNLGDDASLPGKPMSMATFGKFQALSVCVDSISGSREESEAVVSRLSTTLESLALPGRGAFTMPATVEVGCPRGTAHFDNGSTALRVAEEAVDPYPRPSPYQLHVFLMPRVTLRMLSFAPELADRKAAVEEYILAYQDQREAQVPVTLGLYVSADELARTTALEAFLGRSFGLRPVTQASAPPDH
jgi:hypothetical protein